MTLRERLIHFKAKNNFTLKQMANALGYNHFIVCKWMTGKLEISDKAKRNIKFTFGI